MSEPLPATAVVRLSPGSFDPSRLAEVEAMNKKVSAYLAPAIEALSGLIHYYSGVSPTGSIVHISVWDTEEHAAQMAQLKEMIVDARRDAEAAGVTFPAPIVNYPIGWHV